MPAKQDRTADALERDIIETQDEIGETVEELEGALSPSALGRDLLGEDGMETAKEAFEVAKRNPLPVALIAVGAVWLFAKSDAPMIRELRQRLLGGARSLRPSGLRPRSAEPAPIGPPPPAGEEYDRAFATSGS